MDFKIEISCKKCDCSCELRPTDFKERVSMECPNCGQAFPAEVYKHLKTGVIELGQVSEHICTNPEDTLHITDIFTVRIKSYNALSNLFGNNSH